MFFWVRLEWMTEVRMSLSDWAVLPGASRSNSWLSLPTVRAEYEALTVTYSLSSVLMWRKISDTADKENARRGPRCIRGRIRPTPGILRQQRRPG